MAHRIKTVLLFGPPGSGKGTQGKMLGTLPGFVHVACGEVFRSLDPASELGRVFLQYSSRGELVPDDFTARLWREHLAKLVRLGSLRPDTDTLVLDGIPRNVHQAQMLENDIEVIKLIVLRCPNRDEIVRRLKSRALKDNRLDDAHEDTIRERLRIYDEESRPVIEYYPAAVRAEVNALQTPIEVAHDVLCAILGRTQELRAVAPPATAGAKR